MVVGRWLRAFGRRADVTPEAFGFAFVVSEHGTAYVWSGVDNADLATLVRLQDPADRLH